MSYIPLNSYVCCIVLKLIVQSNLLPTVRILFSSFPRCLDAFPGIETYSLLSLSQHTHIFPASMRNTEPSCFQRVRSRSCSTIWLRLVAMCLSFVGNGGQVTHVAIGACTYTHISMLEGWVCNTAMDGQSGQCCGSSASSCSTAITDCELVALAIALCTDCTCFSSALHLFLSFCWVELRLDTPSIQG